MATKPACAGFISTARQRFADGKMF